MKGNINNVNIIKTISIISIVEPANINSLLISSRIRFVRLLPDSVALCATKLVVLLLINVFKYLKDSSSPPAAPFAQASAAIKK